MTDPRKPVFDAVRAIAPAGLFNDPGNILALDNLLDAFGAQRADGSRVTGPKGVALIKRFEGCARMRDDGKIEAYPDPGTGGAPWTIGWGATRIDGRLVKKGDVITQAKADELLAVDIARHAADVIRLLGSSPTSQEQFDTLVSFHFNTGALGGSTLLKKHLAGDFAGAANEFGRWVHAGGRVLPGLVSRRAEEAQLYRSGGG